MTRPQLSNRSRHHGSQNRLKVGVAPPAAKNVVYSQSAGVTEVAEDNKKLVMCLAGLASHSP